MALSAGPTAAAIALKTTKWDDFYADWIKPVGQVIIPAVIALVVLIAVSGLLTRVMVERGALSWERNSICFWTVTGALAMLAFAVFLPVYPMFTPFADATWLTFAFPLAVVLPGVLLVLLASGLRVRCPGKVYRLRRGMPPATVLILLLLWAGLLSCFFSWGDTHRLIVAEIALAVLGITAISTALGQQLRLQVEAQGSDGKVDAAASDYVLARLQNLGGKLVEDLGISRTTDLSNLVSQDLSAIPAGNVAAAIAKILYAIRPGLTWRARITMVDGDRVVVTLTRNSLQAASTVISRPELGLPPLPADAPEPTLAEDQARARAQLLTGATACILVRLSQAHRRLQVGLCGATQWKTVALHVIATEPVLLKDPEARMRLLKRSVDLEPGYGPARIDYVTMLFVAAPSTAANRLRFSRLLEPVQALAKPGDTVLVGWEMTYLRALYGQIAMRVNCFLTEQAAGSARLTALRARENTILETALALADQLIEACGDLRDRSDRQLQRFIDDLVPTAANLRQSIALIQEATRPPGAGQGIWTSPRPAPAPSPYLAYEYACLAALIREYGRPPGDLGELEDHLALAIATPDDKQILWSDPSFSALLRDPVKSAETKRALALGPPLDMLELPPFAPYAEKLGAIGVTTFAEFSARVPGAAARQALATHLGASDLVVSYLAGIARLAAIHQDLSSPEVVAVLLSAGITGPEDLRRRAAADRPGLITALTDLAERRSLLRLPAFSTPDDWLNALRPTRP